MNPRRALLTLAIWPGLLMLPPVSSASVCFLGGDAVDVKGVVDSFDSSQGCYGCPLPGGGTNAGNQADVSSVQRITVRSGGFIGGNVTSTLGSVTLMKGATVDGDVTAGTTVTSQGTVTGTEPPSDTDSHLPAFL